MTSTDRTEAVLKWLDAVLDRALKDPTVLLKVKADVEKHKDLVRGAVEDALTDEFKPYAELVTKIFNA